MGSYRRKCPECGARKVVPILYGYPDPETVGEYKRGEIELGGCVVEDGRPTWSCKACGHSWGKLKLREVSE